MSATETCRRIAPLADRVGITRIADITGLDRLGIYTFSCVRPMAPEGSITVTCGKGVSRLGARAGAIMEAIEYHCSETHRLDVRIDTFERLARTENVLDPRELVLPNWSPYTPDTLVEWVTSRDVVTGETWWVPLNAVVHPYSPAKGCGLLLRGNSNGLASGNTIEEAIFHGLAEVIERDAWSLCWVDVAYGRGDAYPGIEVESHASPEVRWLLERYRETGVELYVRDITSDVGLPAYYATSLELVGGKYLGHEGMGAHVDPTIALSRALTEAAQSRAADIQGSREDLNYWRARASGEWTDADRPWAVSRPTHFTRFPSAGGVRNDDILDDIAWMTERLAAQGMNRVLVADLTRKDLGIPVVRVLVPGSEYVAIDEYRCGARARRTAERAVAHAREARA